MPDSPTSTQVNSAISEDEVELVEETKPKSWPQTLQDLKNNNSQYPTQQQPLVLRPTSDLLRPPTTLLNPWAARFGSQIPPVPPVGGNFPGWIYRGIHPPMPAAFPIGRGHELMRRLCTMNPAFAQSIIEDYIRPQVRIYFSKYVSKGSKEIGILSYFFNHLFFGHLFVIFRLETMMSS